MREIKPINNNGSILLAFTVNGERYRFNPVKLGKYDNDEDLENAKDVSIQILSDIQSGKFDRTLKKYKNVEGPRNDLKDLWTEYEQFKCLTLAESTIEIDYKRRVGNVLVLLPSTNLEDAVNIRDWLLKNKPVLQAKKILTQFNACCNWAVESGLLKVNPFSKTKIKPYRKTTDEDINPFSAEERGKILEAFKNDKYYSHYYLLVSFLFFTGCRPSEAIALTWDDIKGDSITFRQVRVNRTVRDRLKTQRKRIIKANSQVKNIISTIKECQSQNSTQNPYNLVFPSPKKRTYIDWHNFSTRAWQTVLKKLPDIEYRAPYQCRHTFITLAIKAGVSLSDIARHCGNSPKTILDRYAGVSRDFVMPVL